MADFHIDHLFIAVPELAFKVDGLRRLLESGAISQGEYERIVATRQAWKKSGKIVDAAIDGKGVIGRLLAVAPELISVQSVNILRTMGAISESQGHALRLAVRSLSAASRGGLPSNKAQIFSRLGRLVGVNVSHERIDMWRSMGLISATEAERWRGYLNTGTLLNESLAKAKRSKSLLDALLLMGTIPVDKTMINNLIQAGIITPRVGRVYKSVIDLGVKQWKVFEGAKSAEGYRTRLLLVLTGSLNRELLGFLRTIGVIDRRMQRRLLIAEQVARQVNDRMWESLVKRRYRVQPGVAPIKLFARASRADDGEILRLLADAAREARKEALTLAGKPGIGAATRSRQYNLEARGLHSAMRAMWEGVGYLTILGERNVAEAAAESALALQRDLLRRLPPGMEESLLWQAKAGVDAYISREENTYNLSRRVYKNLALFEGKVDHRIKLSLLQGKSATEIAADVYKFIDPKTPGGASYAAMRLARTEIQNAFHFSTIRHTRENPWVRGYKWNLSGSHPRTDVCNDMANDDHDGLGPGVYKKSNVPGKPHPHCFCYLTTVQMRPDEFMAAYQSGRFNSWMRQVARGEAYDNPTGGDRRYAARVAGAYAADWGLDLVAENLAFARGNI